MSLDSDSAGRVPRSIGRLVRSRRPKGADILLGISNRDLRILLRDRRGELGLSQRALARRAGTTQAAISRIERGRTSPTWETVRGLLLAMGCEPEVRARLLEARADSVHVESIRSRSPSERLALALSANRMAAKLRAGGRAARR